MAPSIEAMSSTSLFVVFWFSGSPMPGEVAALVFAGPGSGAVETVEITCPVDEHAGSSDSTPPSMAMTMRRRARQRGLKGVDLVCSLMSGPLFEDVRALPRDLIEQRGLCFGKLSFSCELYVDCGAFQADLLVALHVSFGECLGTLFELAEWTSYRRPRSVMHFWIVASFNRSAARTMSEFRT